jgi:OOP family OmpA-OmpF porin
MKLTLGVKIVLGLIIAVISWGVLSHFGMTPGSKVKEAVAPEAVNLPTEAPVNYAPDKTSPIELPLVGPSTVPGPTVRINIWAWNAQMGLIYANGGPITTRNSLMEKHKVRMQLTRQDDTEKSKEEQIKFATELSEGKLEPEGGVHFVIIMGDGAGTYLASINKALNRLGPDYEARIIGSVGYSRGEDSMWGPQEWLDNPSSMKGAVISGVLRDGDWNIAMDYMRRNGLTNNPDPKVYNPDAVNWLPSDTYLTAVEDAITPKCVDLPVVRGNKRTNETVNKCVEGTVTWTPGDVNLAMKKGGYARIWSTKENPYQMPSVIIGINKWNRLHAKVVEEMLAATFEGGEQVSNYDQALTRAAQAAFKIYKEESPAYWMKYFKGVTEKDKTGAQVPLGGSMVSNLGDNLVLFGLAPGSGGIDGSIFKATYEGFANIVKQQYPELLPEFPSAAQATDLSFIGSLSKKNPITFADVETFEDAGPIDKANVVAKRNWAIQFATGKYSFTPEGEAAMNELYSQLIVSASLAVEIEGHTDDVGDPKLNQVLSEQRAFAVKQWLENKAPTLFPENRVSTQAFGATRPLVPNTSAENRAKNRRVTIVLGTK